MQNINERTKKWIPKILCVIGAEIVVAIIIVTTLLVRIPTVFMNDEKATAYIMEMSASDRSTYIKRTPNKEGSRLIQLMISYYVAEHVTNDNFDSIDTGKNKDTSGKTAKEYLKEAETEAKTYPLSDGSGYVVLNGKETKVYDNNGNEVDPSTKMNKDGIIKMDIY